MIQVDGTAECACYPGYESTNSDGQVGVDGVTCERNGIIKPFYFSMTSIFMMFSPFFLSKNKELIRATPTPVTQSQILNALPFPKRKLIVHVAIFTSPTSTDNHGSCQKTIYFQIHWRQTSFAIRNSRVLIIHAAVIKPVLLTTTMMVYQLLSASAMMAILQLELRQFSCLMAVWSARTSTNALMTP